MRLKAGMHLGPYEIASPLGAGGVGEVYQARDTRIGRDVAVKVLAAGSSDETWHRRFEAEARAAGGLNHPNIVTVHDVGSDNGVYFIVSELVTGKSLRAVFQAGPLPERKAIDC